MSIWDRNDYDLNHISSHLIYNQRKSITERKSSEVFNMKFLAYFAPTLNTIFFCISFTSFSMIVLCFLMSECSKCSKCSCFMYVCIRSPIDYHHKRSLDKPVNYLTFFFFLRSVGILVRVINK